MHFTWETLGNISTVIGLAGSGFALLAWIQAKAISRNTRNEKARLNQEVKIILQDKDDTHKIECPFALRRKELARDEVLGVIGMLPMVKQIERTRFNIHFLSTADFREVLSRVQDSADEYTLVIRCSNEEIDQFDGSKICHEDN